MDVDIPEPSLEESRREPMDEPPKRIKQNQLPNFDELGVALEDRQSILNGISNPVRGTNSPLHISISKNYRALTEWLFKNNEANVNAVNDKGKTPLHCAAEIQDNDAIMVALIRAGASINATTIPPLNETPLHCAIRNNNISGTRILLEAGADSSAKGGTEQQTPLIYAVSKNNVDIVRLLRHTDVNMPDRRGYTPLHYAVKLENLTIMNDLITSGANVNATTSSGTTPLLLALKKDNIDVIRLLLSNRANVNLVDRLGKLPIKIVAESESIEKLELFLDYVDINSPIDAEGNTLLYDALISGNMNNIRLLLTKGANIHAKNKFDTPLNFILDSESTELVDLLLQVMPSIDSPVDDKGNTLLQYACNSQNGNLVLYLKERGANGRGIVCEDIILQQLATQQFKIQDELGVYYFSGHGCDTGQVLPVPPNCLYVTLAICGDSTLFRYNYEDLLRQCGYGLLRDPIGNQKEIERILRRGIQIYGRHAGDTYSELEYEIPLKFTAGSNCPDDYTTLVQGSLPCKFLTYKSGLYTVDTIESHIIDVHEGELFKMDGYRVKRDGKLRAGTNISEKIYENSLLPSHIPPYVKGSDAKETYDNLSKGTITQSMLFKIRPGIYYNLVCRSPCDEQSPEPVNLRREYSIGNRNTINASTINQWFTEDTSKGKVHAVKKLQEVIDDPSVYIVEDTPGEFARAVRTAENRQKLIGSREKESHRLIPRRIGGTRRKKKTKRKTRRIK